MKFTIPRTSLRTRIIAWSFIPTTIILLAVALVAIYAYQRVTEDLVVGRNKELTRLSASQFATDLGGYVNLLSGLARTSNLYSNVPLLQEAALKNASNRLVVFDAGVLSLNPSGVVTAAQPERPDAVGQDWSNRAYFRELVRSVKPVFSDIVADGPGGMQVIAIAVPTLDSQGMYRGALVGMFRLGATTFSAFYGGIVRERIGDAGTAYIVDSNGRVIYHSDSSLIGSDLRAQPVVQRVLNREVDTLRTRDVQGEDILASFAPVPGTPWGLVTEQSWAGLLAAGQGYGQFLLLLLALGIIVPAVVVTIGVRRITEPVAKLIAAAQNVAGGNFGQKIEVRTGDELEELVKQFNRMSDQLSESYSALKEREERLALVTERANDGIWDWNLQTNECYFSPRWKTMLGYAEQELPNRFETWRQLLHPDDVDRAMAEVQMSQTGSKQIFELEHRLRHKDGSYRWVLARGITLRDALGKPYRMAGSHTDITERKQVQEELRLAYQSLERRVEERTHELATLNAIGAVVNRSLDLHEILSDALDKTLESINMEFGAAFRLEGDGDRSEEQPFLNLLVHRGLSEEFIRSSSILPLKGSAIEIASKTGEPLVWDANGTISRFGMSEALAREGIRQVVSIPLLAKGKLNGALYLATAGVRAFDPEQLALLAGIGQQVGVAVENARLYDQAERSAQVAERSRLARELHDSVTQSLYSMTLYAEACARLLNAGQLREAAEHLREMRDTAQEALREMRLLIFELRPPALEKRGLAAALQARLEAVETRGGMQAELHVEGKEKLQPAVQEELYHIAMEGLNNALKHAKAHRVQVSLRFEPDSTYLEVCDDGGGFDPGIGRSGGGYGLSGMAERAQRIGGILHIESSPGKGTSVSVRVHEHLPKNGGGK
jgi:PAS domain S-box-containing protein